ncbi:MAG: TerD family protein [Oscillospiraceae bacterium]|nr:TerD family protein [Oscillospiraceae bacterium]MBQ4310724.1 TerD family protein [Oscillospiraceae bacterium]
MAVNLVKGQKISLSKESNGLAHLLVGLGWDLPKGLFQKAFDLDAFALVCGNDGKIDSMRDVVYFANLRHACGAIVHMGDNLTGAGEGDDEQINIDLTKIPEQYGKIILGVCIYLGNERHQSFDKVKNAFVRLVDTDKNTEICRYTLSDNSAFADRYTMVFGEIYRHNGEWKFSAIGEATPDTSITPMFAKPYIRT